MSLPSLRLPENIPGNMEPKGRESLSEGPQPRARRSGGEMYFLPVMASEENNPNLRLLSGGPHSTLDGSRETSIFRQEDMRGDVKINKHSDERNFSVPSFQSNTCSLKKICPILYRQEVKLFINKNHT